MKKIWEKLRELAARIFKLTISREVVISDDDNTIIVHDGLPPEANAMAMAMYSRSPKSFLIHLAEVMKRGWKKFLGLYYVGYGHKSIGDCGTTNIYSEGVSMLAAKALQHYLLYKGQEASTRFLDMSKQRVINPLKSIAGARIQKTWMDLYEKLLAKLVPHLMERFPIKDGEDPKTYKKAINAKAFDIARAFLPAGATTFVGWHSTLREASDHLLRLRHHPLEEVRGIAEKQLRALNIKYPSSGFDKRYPESEAYVEMFMKGCTYMEPEMAPTTGFSSCDNFDYRKLDKHARILNTRPPKTELPAFMKGCGTLNCKFLIDFGSFRDWQRHRSGITLMPLLSTKYGFHGWYLEQIPAELVAEIHDTITLQMSRIAELDCTPEIKQYYIAMGFQVLCDTTFDLPAMVYTVELRTGQSVHPTLRQVCQKMAGALLFRFPHMSLHADMEPDQWSVKRGTQDIVKKN